MRVYKLKGDKGIIVLKCNYDTEIKAGIMMNTVEHLLYKYEKSTT